MTRRTKILLILGLIIILAVIFLWPRNSYRRQLEAYKKQLIANGEKLTIEELAPPPSMNPSNGAKALLDLMTPYRVSYDYPTNMIPIAPGLKEPGFKSWDPTLTSNYSTNRELMAQLRQVLKAPVLQFNVDYAEGFEVPLTHLSVLKSAEQLATITMTQALYANDFPEAQSDLISAVDLIRLYTNEPFIISGLVRVAMAQIAISATWEALQSDAWTEPQLAQLQQMWQSIDLFSAAPAAIVFERACIIDELAKVRQAPNPDNLILINPVFSTSQPTNGDWLGAAGYKFRLMYNHIRFSRWKSSWSFEEEQYLLDSASAALKCSHSALDIGAFVPAFQAFERQASNIDVSFPDRTNRFLFYDDNGDIYLHRLALTETGRRICVTAIALKRYHLQHGEYPATLNELVPALLPVVPIDFIDGKLLRYKLLPDGDFLLYSVGLDGVDDGGDPRQPPNNPPSSSWLVGRDIVWPRVATPAALEEYRKKYGTTTNAP